MVDISLSGEIYSSFSSLLWHCFTTSSASLLSIELFKNAALIPLARSASTWSFINAIKGEITRVMPGNNIAGTWKQTDFPPPVGISTRVSFLFSTPSIICACKGRNCSYPKYFLRISCGLIVACIFQTYYLICISNNCQIFRPHEYRIRFFQRCV